MNKLRALLADAQSNFSRLTQRERRLVALAGTAVAGFALFLILFSFASSAAGYRRRTEDKLRKLSEVQGLAASYREAEQARQGVERQLSANGIRLISYIEEKGTAAGLDISKMDPKQDAALGDGKIVESVVEVTLTDISLGKLVDFLAGVESAQGVVKVKYLRIEPKVPAENLTAWVTIATYKLKP